MTAKTINAETIQAIKTLCINIKDALAALETFSEKFGSDEFMDNCESVIEAVNVPAHALRILLYSLMPNDFGMSPLYNAAVALDDNTCNVKECMRWFAKEATEGVEENPVENVAWAIHQEGRSVVTLWKSLNARLTAAV